jgi:hypothetical protein
MLIVRSSIPSRSRLVSAAPGPVRLVDHEDVGDLEQAGLGRLHGVAPAGVDDHDGGVGGPRDLHLDLADPDRLEQDPRRAGGVEHPHGLGRGERQATEVPAGGHERMKTPASSAWSCMRTRSPRMAPPVNGDEGSMASTATCSPRPRSSPISALVSVDLPAPGAPVRPTV